MHIDSSVKLKWRAHETFFIRKGWLSKGMEAVKKKNDIFMDKTINPMDELGIGSNMVKSLRYWLQAVGITTEKGSAKGKRGKRSQSFTDLGNIIYEHDPYIEEIGTLFVLHHHLANSLEFAPSWYFFFNQFSMKSFTQEDFIHMLNLYAANDLGVDAPPVRSSTDDFTCILGTYISKGRILNKTVHPENNIDCPLGELELISVDGVGSSGKIYRKRQVNPDVLPPLICLYGVLSYRDSVKSSIDKNNDNALKLNELLNNPGSPGKIFNLDSIGLVELLRKLELQGYLRVNRTAGMDEVRLTTSMDANDCLKKYYQDME